MILKNLLLSTLLFFTPFLFSQTANHLVVSEILIDGINESSATTNDEFVEFYNPTSDPIDVSNWSIAYRSASGTTFNIKYTFPSGTLIQSHKYYLFGGGGVISRDNSSESQLLGLGNTGGGLFLRNSSGNIIDLIGWGSAASGNYEGTVAVKPAQGISLERKANSFSSASSMGIGGADELEGNGFDSDNNATDFVQRTTPQPQNSSSPAEPTIDTGGNGTGNVSVFPNVLDVSESIDLMFKIDGDGTHTLDSVLIVIPSSSGWIWSSSISDVIISGGAAVSHTVSIEGDTIYIGSVTVKSIDSLIVKILNVTSPSNSGYTDFPVKTAVSGGIPLPVSPLPRVNVLKVVPIVDVHINDALGVPVSPYGLGTAVTITGIITADFNNTRTDVYVQDETAGINLFSFSRYFDYLVGDSVTVTGTILQFRGLTEISPDSALFFIHSHGNKVPEPMVLTAAQVNQTFNIANYTEPNEGRLVRLDGVTYNSSDQMLTDETGITGAYFGNLTAPGGTFDIIGILKQYKPGMGTPTPPFTSDYEINVRTQADVIVRPGPNFVSKPVEENIRPDSITISFKTSVPSEAVIKFGKTPSYTDSIVVSSLNTDHSVILSGLWPAAVYHYQVVVSDSSGTNYTGDAIFSTASPYGSTGKIDVFFNKSVDTSVSRGENAQTINLSQKFINRINAAQYSVDAALYSLSGAVGANVASSFISAKNRGVKVRVIGEKDNQSTAPWNTLKSNGITVIDDGFDATNAGAGLMHNKFAVFDYRDTSNFTDDWIWSGSWNATDSGTDTDAQNSIEIQDKSLAGAYTLEFNEMWGSDSDVPNSSNSRFGIRKTNNTPHLFNIDGTPIELYFDPSDQTTTHIGDALNATVSSINVAMLTFTQDNLANILVNQKTAEKKVRVILDNNTDSGNEFSYLQTNEVDIHLKGNALTGYLHHKYAVIDAETNLENQTIITGSHNWSNAAETTNNENTLIIHSKRIANLYLQEFKARYLEAGGTDTISIITNIADNYNDKAPIQFYLYQNYPNPFNPTTNIDFSIPQKSKVTLSIYNTLGQIVSTLINEEKEAGIYQLKFNASTLSSGVYFYKISTGEFNQTKKLILLK